ncbi:hypothetical protein A2U01_0091942, partial [Trifolium medium]|nr:hypothetical protein [Trifolium medium]
MVEERALSGLSIRSTGYNTETMHIFLANPAVRVLLLHTSSIQTTDIILPASSHIIVAEVM